MKRLMGYLVLAVFAIGAALLAVSCYDGMPGTWHYVMIDNRTAQDFIVIQNDYETGTLRAGGVLNVAFTKTKNIQLRWLALNNDLSLGVNIIYFPLDKTIRKVYIQGSGGDYTVEFVGIEKGAINENS